MNIDINKRAADNIRILAMSMVEKSKSGHPGGAMGGADYIHILFSEFLNFDPTDPAWINRDRFFLDPGHMSAMLYSILMLTGHFTIDELKNFRQWGSPTPGHPELDIMRGIENTSGPLGQGHTMAVGAAIAERFLTARFGELFAHKIFTYISDGGVQEEISQGAGRLAGFLGLSNLIMFYDSNDIQLSTETKSVTIEDTGMKYTAWGWNVIKIDGNDQSQIRMALRSAVSEKNKPTIIIGKTIMGKGLLDKEGNSFERRVSTHGMPVSEAGGSFEKSLVNLGGDISDPFKIFKEVKEFYSNVKEAKFKKAAAWKKGKEEWASQNKELNKKLNAFYSHEVPDIDYKSIPQKEGSATRAASAAVLGVLASKIENMIVASADLSNSDKTDGFLKNTHAFSNGDFSGAFLQTGVSELTMAAVMNGMALHGGVIPACGTFFVFSDYMKPAIRLACLMELPVKYIWTHDAFRVGEDGPTHQPVEQEAQLRLLEHLKNHHGGNSMVVLRPSDSAETTVAWKMALENKKTPTALILSRQSTSGREDHTMTVDLSVPVVHLHIGGEARTNGSGGVHQHVYPATGEIQGPVPLAGPDDVGAAVEAAQAAYAEWRARRPAERARVLRRLGELMERDADEIARLSVLDNGMSAGMSRPLVDIMASWTSYYAGWADKIEGRVTSFSSEPARACLLDA